MKQRNAYPWLKGRSFTKRPAPDETLHPGIDRKKLQRLAHRIERSLLRQLAQPVIITQVAKGVRGSGSCAWSPAKWIPTRSTVSSASGCMRSSPRTTAPSSRSIDLNRICSVSTCS